MATNHGDGSGLKMLAMDTKFEKGDRQTSQKLQSTSTSTNDRAYQRDDLLDVEIEKTSSLDSVRQLFSHTTIKKLVVWSAKWRPSGKVHPSSGLKQQIDLLDSANCDNNLQTFADHPTENFAPGKEIKPWVNPFEEPLHHESEPSSDDNTIPRSNTSNRVDDLDAPRTSKYISGKEEAPDMHNLCIIGLDQEGRRSFASDNSERPNKFQRYIQLRDILGRQCTRLVLFDTGAGSSFITRGTLLAMGNPKDYKIPGKINTYRSPIDASAHTTPTHCIYFSMWCTDIGFSDRQVKLKIIEVPEVLPIMVGRHLMDNHPQLLSRLQQCDSNVSEVESYPDVLAPVLKARRSKKERIDDEAMNNKYREQLNKDFLERQRALSSTPQTRLGAPPTGHNSHTAGSPMQGDWRGPETPLNYQQTASSGSAAYGDTGPAWQMSKADRTDTASTQNTQLTGWSTGGESTTSSNSSWSAADVVAPQTWKPAGSSQATGEKQNAGQDNGPDHVYELKTMKRK